MSSDLLSFKDFLIREGSARASHTKRGAYAKKRKLHLSDVESSEKERGVVHDPNTDARSYGRTHTTPYNTATPDTASAKKLKTLKKKKTVPLPVSLDSPTHISDILSHPHYQRLINKHA